MLTSAGICSLDSTFATFCSDCQLSRLGMSEPLGDNVEDAAVVRDQGILRQPADAESGLAPDDALLR